MPGSTQGQQHGGLTDRSAVLPVAEVVDIVREWVDLQARHQPGFGGAHLWGGNCTLAHRLSS